MIKVLYCHGMGGEGLSGYPKLLRHFKGYGIELVSPTVNHSIFINNKHIFPAMMEVANDVDVVIGNSMGGYFAYHLGKACGKPTLCFNPAISEVTTSYNWFKNVTTYEPSENQEKTLILMGTEDTVVDHYHGKKFVENNGFDTDEIEYLEGETHSLEFDLIFQRIVRFVSEYRQKMKQEKNQ